MVQAYREPHRVQDLERDRKGLSWEEAGTCSCEQKGQGGNPVSMEGDGWMIEPESLENLQR